MKQTIDDFFDKNGKNIKIGDTLEYIGDNGSSLVMGVCQMSSL